MTALRIAIAAAAVAAIAAGCGSGSSSPSSGGSAAGTSGGAGGSPAIAPPESIASSGKLVFCSDISYPPEEFYEGSEAVGSDIEIGADIARRMGVTAEFDNTGFDGIIPALLSNKCDAIISGMNDTPERAKQVTFIDYLRVGQSIMVPKGNPKGVTGLMSICGLTAGAQIGTTNLDTLNQASKDCEAAGKPKIDIVSYKKDTDGATALKTDKLDVYESDSPVVAFYVEKGGGAFEFAGDPIDAQPVGIAVRPDDTELQDGIKKAIDAMYADGTIRGILDKWSLSDFALKQ